MIGYWHIIMLFYNAEQGRLNVGGMTHFAPWEMLGEAERCCHGVRFETRGRCISMRWRLGSAPGPVRGAYGAPPDPLARFGSGQ